jgi:predicted SprT family Zn-dependent metalloprotease
MKAAPSELGLMRELLRSFHALNHTYFKGVLKTPQLILVDSKSYYGRYHHVTRVIELSRPFVLEQTWGVVLEVLKHELAHQFVHEVLGEQEEPHGPAFRAVCERLGIDPSARGLPVASKGSAQHVLDRVHRLLALAQSDNQHEAEAAAAAAQRLMLRHNIASADLGERSDYGFAHLGRITGRVTEWERRLGNVLGSHFFVEVIWVPAFDVRTQKRGSVLEAIGTPENLALASYVHAFLCATAERCWAEHRRAQGLRGNRDRLVFYAGVMSGFAESLERQAKVHRKDGLVYVPHAQLDVYTRKRHPRLRTVSHQGSRRGDAFAEGQRAGRGVVLQRGIKAGPSGDVRLLKG